MPTPILMPALSPTMEEGTLAKWLVKEGDVVSAGDVIAEIETDKATMEVEAVDEGTIGKIVVPAGTEGVAVNNPIAYLLEEGESASDIPAGGNGSAGAPVAKPEAVSKPEKGAAPREAAPQKAREAAAETKEDAPVRADAAPAPKAATAERIAASPLAKRLAEAKGLDLSSLKGSGPNGRIVKRDVEEAAAASAASAPAAQAVALRQAPQPSQPSVPAVKTPAEMGLRPGAYDEVPMDAMRKVIARRMTESKQQVPHFPVTMDCEIDKLLAVRKDLNEKAGGAYKISVNDFVIRAAALALKKLPDVNVSFADYKILKHHHADIAVAVSIEGGLITPIIFEAESKGLKEISIEMKDKAERARIRKLMPEEYQGGTFSISNLGMFGVREFSAIINQPHGAILAVGAGEQRPVVKKGSLQIATVMTCTLSCDHRVVDGALGARWLGIFKALVEDPLTMLL